jgi:hypothetical protein
VSKETVMMTPGFTHVPHMRWCFVILAAEVWNVEMRVVLQCLPRIDRARDSIVHGQKNRRPCASRHATPVSGLWTESWMAGHWAVEARKRPGRDFFHNDSTLIGVTPLSMRGSPAQRPALVQVALSEARQTAARASRAGRSAAEMEPQVESPDGPARGTAIVNGASLVGVRKCAI